MPSTLIDPASKLRPDHLSGVEVVMADGQKWLIPKPRISFSPDSGERGYAAVLGLGRPDNYQGLLDARETAIVENQQHEEALEAAAAGGGPMPEPLARSGHPVVRAEIALFSTLVLRNYSLTPEELPQILAIAYDEAGNPEGFALRSTLLDIAEGNAPKTPADTSV